VRQAFSAKQAGFTLVEIMIVAAIIALLAASAVPGFLRARKRSQSCRILHDLRSIDSGVDQCAIEIERKSSDPVAVSDWTNYLRKETSLHVTGQALSSHGDTTPDPQIGNLSAI
jgi:prepilin-type N-terminal cleavage/methylation domain-containing protein